MVACKTVLWTMTYSSDIVQCQWTEWCSFVEFTWVFFFFFFLTAVMNLLGYAGAGTVTVSGEEAREPFVYVLLGVFSSLIP